jgi:tRNA(fMet)-specific endonuclease VapC
MFLFDTNVLSEVIKKRPSPILLKRLSGLAGDLQTTSCICVMEMRYGARRRPDSETFWKKIDKEVLSRLRILPLTIEAAVIAGDVAAALSLKGFGISAEDLLIAATALESNLTLITRNTKHFQKIPNLKVENWFA